VTESYEESMQAVPGQPMIAGNTGNTGSSLLTLVTIMDRLRRECPWDAKQTHESLAPHLLEETYEALAAIEQEDMAALRDELGDVLLQVMFHARLASERTDETGFAIDDVADGIADKLVRRHPHVFGDVSVSGPDEVKRNWDQIKAAERAAASAAAGEEPGALLDGVPMGQPALALAAQLQRRAANAGAPAELGDLAGGGGVVGGSAELGASAAVGGSAETEGEMVSDIGAELFALVARARAAGVDPEFELRRAARIYRDRVHAWERGK
jgi:MazG family protein